MRKVIEKYTLQVQSQFFQNLFYLLKNTLTWYRKSTKIVIKCLFASKLNLIKIEIKRLPFISLFLINDNATFPETCPIQILALVTYF